MSEEKKPPERSTVWLILAVCVAPFVASVLAYFWWQPDARVNYGELLLPTPVPAAQLSLYDGSAFSLPELKGKWIMVTVDSGACNAYCRQKLWKMRQVRLAQGVDMDRIERVWLVSDDTPPAPAVMKEYAGTYAVRAAGSPVLAALPYEHARSDHIYLVDPLGNLMLRYPRDADPSRMRKDLVRLLKVSRVG